MVDYTCSSSFFFFIFFFFGHRYCTFFTMYNTKLLYIQFSIHFSTINTLLIDYISLVNSLLTFHLHFQAILQTYLFENAMSISLTKLLRSCQKKKIGKQTLMLLKLQSCVIIFEEHCK